MKFTNINIQSPYGPMKYYVGYEAKRSGLIPEVEIVQPDNGEVYMCFPDGYYRDTNEWLPGSPEASIAVKRTSNMECAVCTLYFPQFSVDTYNTNTTYAVDFITYIKGRKLHLATYIVKRSDAVAADTVMKLGNDEYFEKVDLAVPNPYDISYTPYAAGHYNWSILRKGLFGSTATISGGSSLIVSIHPVVETENGYMMMDDYHGGANAINVSDDSEDYLSLENSIDPEDPTMLKSVVKFNRSLGANLSTYLSKVYGLTGVDCKLEHYIYDGSDVYAYYEDDPATTTDLASNATAFTRLQDILKINTWDGYKEGMYIETILNITQQESNSTIYIKSNKIPVTKQVFSYMIIDENIPSKIDLSKVNMNVVEVKAVNKIEKTVVQVERPDDYKSNLIKPVFFRSYPLGKVTIHPEVSENICINLNNYVTKVKSFSIRIEGVVYPEISRNNAGVVFKIQGTMLPQANPSGIYYILDENGELVTTGNYIYEI